jgi:hypothetical protein
MDSLGGYFENWNDVFFVTVFLIGSVSGKKELGLVGWLGNAASDFSELMFISFESDFLFERTCTLPLNLDIVSICLCSYTPLSGFYGVLSGLLVGINQLLPDQELNLFVLKIKAKVHAHFFYKSNPVWYSICMLFIPILTPHFCFCSGFRPLLHLS